MQRLLHALRIATRATAVALLLVGLPVWAGQPGPWRGLHLALGAVLAAVLLTLGGVAVRATRRAGPLLVAVAWTALLVGYGLAHGRLWPGGAHWVAQLLHVLIGLATIGVAERVAAGARRDAGL